MIYKNFGDEKLSSLGLGCMRFPVIEGDISKIDVEKTREIVDYAIKNGVNYFDTAWGYHNGFSESVMGEILSGYPRDSFYLASKFPGYDTSTFENKESIFEKQLEKCRVDYFDFYLFHSVTDKNLEYYLDEKYAVADYLKKQKEMGRIKHIGFSCHCSLETMKTFIDTYRDLIEFCQIQLNWLDWEYQNAKAKVEMLNEYGIAIWVMEPVRGGSLAKMADRYESRLKECCPDRTMPEWAFKYLQSIDGITVTLSGMSNMEQLKENIATFSVCDPVTDTEKELLYDIAKEIISKPGSRCTGCAYCTEYCPQKLNIPRLISAYNDLCDAEGGNEYKKILEDAGDRTPDACIGCKKCQKVCPQRIKISEIFADFTEKLK